MKNIVFFNKNLRAGGGTERSTINIANSLSVNKEYTVHLISIDYGTHKESTFKLCPSIKEVGFGVNNLRKDFFKVSNMLKRYIVENDIDVVVFSEVLNFIFSIKVLGFFSKNYCKLIVWEHFNSTVDLNRKSRCFARKLAARYADSIICLTNRDRDLWINKYKISGNIVAIPNASPFVNDSLEYNVESKKIIAVGRLSYQKGFDLLLKVWYDLKVNKKLQDFTLEIIGQGEDEDSLREKIIAYDLSDCVSINTSKPDMIRVYKEASFLVMTSRFEGLPMVLIEAQSFGLPIVAYDCLTGPSDILINNSGFLVNFDDEKMFASRVYDLILDDKLRTSISFSSYEMSKRYKIDSVLKLWEVIL